MAAGAFRRVVSVKLAADVSLVLLLLLTVFHLLVLAGMIQYNVVWGGRLESASQMVYYETFSLLVIAAFIVAVAWRAGYIAGDSTIPRRFMWLPAVFFLASVIGNLAASSDMERAVFTPVALILALLSLRLAMKD